MITTASSSSLPLEFLELPETSIDEPKPSLAFCFTCEPGFDKNRYSYRGRILGESHKGNYDLNFGFSRFTAKERLRSHLVRTERCQMPTHDARMSDTRNFQSVSARSVPSNRAKVILTKVNSDVAAAEKVNNVATHQPIPTSPVCFATHDAYEVLDLGASKTVIGSEHVKGLIQSLDEETRSQLTRCPCEVTFKFGNQGTLTSSQAIVVPIGKLRLKIAIVKGGTPFLISNTFMRAIRAKIDCFSHSLSSPMLNHAITLELTERGLFLLNLSDVVKAAMNQQSCGSPDTKSVEATFLSTEKSTAATAAETLNSDKPSTIDFSMPLTESVSTKDFQEATGIQVLTSEANVDHEMNDDHREPTVQDPCRQPDRTLLSSHVSPCPPEGCSDRSGGAADRLVSVDTRRAEDRGGLLRTEAPGGNVRDGLGGSRLDQLHGVEVWNQQSPQPSSSDQVRGVDGGAPRKNEHPSACAATAGIGARRLRLDRRAFWTQIHPSQGQGHEHSSIWGHRTHSTGPGRRAGVRDVQPGDDGHDSSPPGSGVHCSSGSYPEHGERSGPRDQAPGGPDREAVDMSDPESETVAESCLAMHQDVQELHQMIQKFTQELEGVLSSSKPLGKPFMMGEVFCSDASPLTQQVLNMGHQAFRFGLAQGDLSTIGGRQKLFQMIASHRPKHLWYSPVCGPWSSWSALNASRSLESQWEYQQQRSDLRYQIALGVVLYRYQVSRGLHFSWEQPQKSLMLLHPGLNEIHQHTQVSQFDMCEASALRDPVNQLHMKKGMQVVTTHEPLFRALHGRTCKKNHDHQHLEGSTQIHGHSVLRTKFSEIYPRKFVRLVAKVFVPTWSPLAVSVENRSCPVSMRFW